MVLISWDYIQGYTSRHWPACDGVIVQSELVALPNNKKQRVPAIYYKYTVQGREYYSRRLAMYVAQTFKIAEAEKMLETYPLGRQVRVRHHPFFHRRAVLPVVDRFTRPGALSFASGRQSVLLLSRR